ncbi:MAG: hypothetical protein RJA63_1751 [Pseudomonadota bacterium]|jgi:signal transduction histidine kinase/CheY-like chemotaxis protein/purine-cytosine permease-like protein
MDSQNRDSAPDAQDRNPVQRVVKVRRDYNAWVAKETIEDYALRFTPRSFRHWHEFKVANTAFGTASFLVLEAVGATLLVQYGFINAALAILVTGCLIFACGLPISHYAAKYGLDMDLLTRGAGFGYIGSTITSLVYASFTFVFFALEAAIMAYALELAFDIPPAWGYLVCALAVIPLATHGITVISRLQTFTQPIWLVLLIVPFVYVLTKNPGVLSELATYPGATGQGGDFNLALFGSALTVGIALITQMAEQVDYLRFMPERTAENGRKWQLCVLVGGPGWVILGVLKMLGGCLLAYLAIRNSVPVEHAVDPNQMYLIGFENVFTRPGWAIAATAVFVVISQLKINVTNAYAGSLAWSNFFARLTHSHPGRVVWMVFNTLIALMLMEMGVFQALGQVLGLYSNIAIAWLVAVVADLVINKPLGLSPAGIEFRRAYLYDINPVGVGAMAIASVLSVSAYVGLFGVYAQSFSSFIAFIAALTASPLIAWYTKGRYYLARERSSEGENATLKCSICERIYEADDVATCPAYEGHICSLCCSLDARCHDLCKPHARLSAQWSGLLQRLLPKPVWPYLDTGLSNYLLLMTVIVCGLSLLMSLLYFYELGSAADVELARSLRPAFLKAYFALLVVSAIVAWWLILTHESRRVAQEESNRQTHLLIQEIESHRRTDEQLQRAKHAADAANQAKSRYITSVSHELRTPLNSILGYAQILDGDPTIPDHRRQAIKVIRRSGDHLLSLIEETLDLARIEGGKLSLDIQALEFSELLLQLTRMFELQAANKGVHFRFVRHGEVPEFVRADERRLRQILINLLGNAVKFTETGSVSFSIKHAHDIALFEIEDTGPGIGPEELVRVFEPFARGDAAQRKASGTGLGLTIANMLTNLMGGELTVSSRPGVGTRFSVKLFLPTVLHVAASKRNLRDNPHGYLGPRRKILVVDNEQDDREMLVSVLAPLGFILDQAASGAECLEVVPRFQPDIIFMDLAMPGFDGWETIRRVRALPAIACQPHIAIISANAFDKGLDNDAAIQAQDFFVKPVRVSDLFDWIQRRLEIEWSYGAPRFAAVPSEAVTEQTVPAHWLEALAEQISLGYVRGIQGVLSELAAAAPEHNRFVTQMRQLVAEFKLDAMSRIVQGLLHAHAPN